MINSILAIDPGSAKCGLAVVSREDGVLTRKVVNVTELESTLIDLNARFDPTAVVIGSGTGSKRIVDIADSLSAPVVVLDERFTTQDARVRYFAENPPRGWRKLVPQGMQVPPEPYDDYAAILLAELFFEADSDD